MTDNLPSVVEVTNEEGAVHWTSPYSELAKKMAAVESEVVPDAPQDDAPADNDDPGTSDDQSGIRERGSRTSDR